jgi:hypothetical protein
MPIASPRNRAHGTRRRNSCLLPGHGTRSHRQRTDCHLCLLLAKIHQKECIGEEEGRLTYLWLIILVFLFMLYGLYTWGV